MFYGQCWKCGERWELGTAPTCTCKGDDDDTMCYRSELEAAVKAERNILAAWMIQRGYATGHGDTTEDLLKELEWQIAENWTNALVKGVEEEREACAKLCEEEGLLWGRRYAAAIRARGQG